MPHYDITDAKLLAERQQVRICLFKTIGIEHLDNIEMHWDA